MIKPSQDPDSADREAWRYNLPQDRSDGERGDQVLGITGGKTAGHRPALRAVMISNIV